MGKALSYCYKCSRLIREEEFAKGKAFNLGDRVSCAVCARQVGAVVVPGAAPPPQPTSTARTKVVVIREPAKAKPALFIALGAFVLGVLVIAAVIAVPGNPEPPSTIPAPPSPREASARQALEAARGVGGEVKAKRQAMERVASDYGDTPSGAQAKKELAVLRDLTREIWKRELQTLEEKLREPLAKRRFGTVAALLEEALKLDTDPGWTEPLKKRLQEIRVEAAKMDADLVGHWTFDEGQGFKVSDSSGVSPAGEIKGATWVDGRIGKALRFSGNAGSYVEIPNSPELDTLQENSFTIAAWFKPEDANESKSYALVIKAGRHTGLSLRGRFAMNYYLSDLTYVGATYLNPPPTPGRFHHLAGVLDRPQGLIRLVVDGKEMGTAKFNPAAKTYNYETQRWRFGISSPHAGEYVWPALGTIDDVRFYKRALSDEEIQRLIPK